MDITQRFTGRAEEYAKFRPHYPDEIYTRLINEKIIVSNSVIADIGCGTGLSAKLFVEKGHTVFGIEPNEEMLSIAKKQMVDFPNFNPVAAKADCTTLKEQSVDVVICAQAFHWFNTPETRNEFIRILKGKKKVVLMWNERETQTSDFLKVYEDFLKMFSLDYLQVDHRKTQHEMVLSGFYKNVYEVRSFYNEQMLDLAGLTGRVLSSSYMPDKTHADYEFMRYCLKKIFQRYQQGNKIKLEYKTLVYTGELKTI